MQQRRLRTASSSAQSPIEPIQSGRPMPLPILALAIASFCIGTTEFVIMGLLPEVAADLGVSIPSAGLLVTGYALGVVFGAPVVAMATAHLPRKPVLVGLTASFVVGNLSLRHRARLLDADGRARLHRLWPWRLLRHRLGRRRQPGAAQQARQRHGADVCRPDAFQHPRRSRRHRAWRSLRLARHLRGRGRHRPDLGRCHRLAGAV